MTPARKIAAFLWRAGVGRTVDGLAQLVAEAPEYKRLQERDRMLDCLLAAGIDNTEAYEQGMREFMASEDEG